VIIIAPACRRELDELPMDVRGDLADVLARLDAGLMLTMPLSAPCRASAEVSTSCGFGIVRDTTE
jgi:hypothetical protein